MIVEDLFSSLSPHSSPLCFVLSLHLPVVVFIFILSSSTSLPCPRSLPRLTPYEWYNPHPCLKGRCNLLINQYSLGNSFWFPVGGFMQQGSTIAPRALSTRCVSGVWLVFLTYRRICMVFFLPSNPNCLTSMKFCSLFIFVHNGMDFSSTTFSFSSLQTSESKLRF